MWRKGVHSQGGRMVSLLCCALVSAAGSTRPTRTKPKAGRQDMFAVCQACCGLGKVERATGKAKGYRAVPKLVGFTSASCSTAQMAVPAQCSQSTFPGYLDCHNGSGRAQDVGFKTFLES